jgi:hypothetical protein
VFPLVWTDFRLCRDQCVLSAPENLIRAGMSGEIGWANVMIAFLSLFVHVLISPFRAYLSRNTAAISWEMISAPGTNRTSCDVCPKFEVGIKA